jgi:hypothetical protein
MWLRNSQMMNDFSEIQHGLDCLSAAWRSDVCHEFKELLERIQSGLCHQIEAEFDQRALSIRLNTFITSLSEHADGS